MSFAPGLIGAVLGAWGLWLSWHGLKSQRTAEVIAEELGHAVVRSEAIQYRQLLGSGYAAPNGRIDLVFSVTATGINGPHPLGTLEGAIECYRSVSPGRVVITGTSASVDSEGNSGDAGTGKTVLALSLMLGLAKQRGAGEPVPVRLTAASWPGSEIRKWISDYLEETYHFSAGDARAVVEADLVLPVIDGLDEMDSSSSPGYESRSASLLRAVERFESGGAHCPVVITCRHSHYEALVNAEAQPQIVANFHIARVDPMRAHSYIAQRVAGTARGRARWQPVLDALEATSRNGSASAASVALTSMLDTPWRLTLATTVFQERTQGGTYLRDPRDLIALAVRGELYAYLLDRYIGAALAAPYNGIDQGVSPTYPSQRARNRVARLNTESTWKQLAILAQYLNGNTHTSLRHRRIVAGRVLSSTDLVLHELWPIFSPRRVRIVDYLLTLLLSFSFLILPSLAALHERGRVGLLSIACVGFLSSLSTLRAWPQPHHFDLSVIFSLVGRRTLFRHLKEAVIIGGAMGTLLWILEDASTGLLAGSSMGVGLAILNAIRDLTMRGELPATDPREIVHGDAVALLGYGVTLGSMLCILAVAGGNSGEFTFVLSFGFLFGLMAGAGRVALRYMAFLFCGRGKLTWRLGRFLDDCYRLGILRIAGNAWQFRHRELQDHLASRPLPAQRP
ncbi:NACHT domain-containing protein [Streptomyces sp. SLBN-115]|nr:NACHT domain-containing protein [Streptomyces sp. SLBN-115]